MKHVYFAILTVVLAAAAGCQQECRPGRAQSITSPTERRLAKQASNKDEQRAEVAALIEKAAQSNAADDRGLAALAVADHALNNIVNTVQAIDTARRASIENLSNLDTIAYKRSIVRVGEGGRALTAYLDLEQGSLERTGRPLDVAIQGQGFFKIKLMDSIGGGVGYTRNGNFFVNNIGELVLGMGDGDPLFPKIIVPPDTSEISISQNGKIEVLSSGSTLKKEIGQLKVIHFMNPQSLQPQGGTIFCETNASGPPRENIPGDGGSGLLVQGYLESSNVDLTHERLRLQFLNEWRSMLLRAAAAPRQ